MRPVFLPALLLALPMLGACTIIDQRTFAPAATAPPQAVISTGRASSRAGARSRRRPDETGVMCMISG